MAFPGNPASYSGTFIPEVWSTKINYKYYEATVLSNIGNTDWEGEIRKHGDRVKIRQRPDITVRDYTKNSSINYEHPEAPAIDLDIDKGKYWATQLDDVDAAQSDIDLLDEFAEDASNKMKIAIDTDVLGNIYADADASNVGATAGKISSSINLGAAAAPAAVDSSNILSHIVNAGTVLDEQNIPEEQRWILLPAIFVGMIKQSDLKDASLAGDGTSIMRNGRVGQIDRFTVYSSNLLSYADESGKNAFNCIFGHPSAFAYAMQVTKVQRLLGESSFSELLRGLSVYGYKVNLPAGIGNLYAVAA